MASMSGPDIIGTDETEIFCSVQNGDIYSAFPWPFPWVSVQPEFAFTIARSDHVVKGTKQDPFVPQWIDYDFTAHEVCSTDSDPPDMPVFGIWDTVDQWYPSGWLAAGFCFRGVIAGVYTP